MNKKCSRCQPRSYSSRVRNNHDSQRRDRIPSFFSPPGNRAIFSTFRPRKKLTNFCAPFFKEIPSFFCGATPVQIPRRTQPLEYCISSRKRRSFEIRGRGGESGRKGTVGRGKKEEKKDAQKVLRKIFSPPGPSPPPPPGNPPPLLGFSIKIETPPPRPGASDSPFRLPKQKKIKNIRNVHQVTKLHMCRKPGKSTGSGSQRFPRILGNFGNLQEGSAERFTW